MIWYIDFILRNWNIKTFLITYQLYFEKEISGKTYVGIQWILTFSNFSILLLFGYRERENTYLSNVTMQNQNIWDNLSHTTVWLFWNICWGKAHASVNWVILFSVLLKICSFQYKQAGRTGLPRFPLFYLFSSPMNVIICTQMSFLNILSKFFVSL